MSIVFVVGSEEELSSGGDWCAVLARRRGLEIQVIVPGSERKTLAELSKRRLAELVGSDEIAVHVQSVEPSAGEVRQHARAARCSVMLQIYRSDNEKFQKQLFEESRFAALWLRPAGSPPTSTDQLTAALRTPSRATRSAVDDLFGFGPSTVICDETQWTVHDESSDLTDLLNAKLDSQETSETGSLVVCDVEHARPHDRVYQAGLALLKRTDDRSFALVHPGDTPWEAAIAKLRHWAEAVAPPMEREERIALAQSLETGSHPNLEFLGLISASSMLASFGLLQNSASVIIGAMLIAPLMTPIVGAGMGLTQGNRPLFQSAFRTVLIGFVGALVSSMLFGWLYLCFHPPVITSEMWARCQPSPLDFCVGLVGGIAASYAQTRSHLSSALAGAAIAAALVPPIATAGLQLSFWQWQETDNGIPVVGPLLLVSVNVLTIMIGSSFVLWARGMRSDRSLSTKQRWVPRMIALLSLLALLILIWTLQPFPDN